MTNRRLYDLETRNQILLERLKNGLHSKFKPYLKEIDAAVRDILSKEGVKIVTKKDLDRIIRDVNSGQYKILDKYIIDLTSDLKATSANQAAFEYSALREVSKGVQKVSNTEAWWLANNRPMSVLNAKGKGLLEPFMREWTVSSVQRVETAISQGYYQGKTLAEITQDIRGTRINGFKDGQLYLTNNQNKAIVRTTVQHISAQAKQAVFNANADIVDGLEWVSVLDARTTEICRELDGKIYAINEGPRPPIHPNCRSTMVAVVND